LRSMRSMPGTPPIVQPAGDGRDRAVGRGC
jgi:hypothetical protein